MSVSITEFIHTCLSFDKVTEAPHFEKKSFRVKNKIFATLDVTNQKATIKLNEIQQSVFCSNPIYLSPVPNKWGKQGWTIIHLENIPKEMCWDALQTAYQIVSQ
ncbi:MmcQ/YjbR family DNA-binding protein [Flavobacterium sp. J27]|uniref:MmcQ/YjbR family DNA-binding protein n=1 Tax=Flavobacterium sp. J27 TaxID=2060419 RepID=UPI00102FBFA9|nr:MmcQ/YjbR family DNA-binding protein [Flavobacterium sp. J27]